MGSVKLMMTGVLGMMLLSGCIRSGDDNVDTESDETGRAHIHVQSSALSIDEIDRVTVTVSGDGINPNIVETIPGDPSAGWSGVVDGIRAGDERVFWAEAFDSAGTLIYAGSAESVTIERGETATVSIFLQQVNPPEPFENAVPIMTGFAISSGEVLPSQNVIINVTAIDPNPEDALTYSWTADGGAFSNSTLPNTIWTAPAAEGDYHVTITVTDPHGAAAAMTATIGVYVNTGSAIVLVNMNSWPEITGITAEPSHLNDGEFAAIELNVSDSDGDPLSYQWSANCNGTFDDDEISNPTFILNSSNDDTLCDLNVIVADGRGGQTEGTLSISIGPPISIDIDTELEPVAFDWQDAVIYYAMVDRFFDGDLSNNEPISGVEDPANFKGGDWAGITQKITEGYFNDLGVNTLWLTMPTLTTNTGVIGMDGHPISAYEGGMPMDLNAVQQRFGSMQELVDLVDTAHDNGIKVIVDYVMNHVHIDSPVYAEHPDWFWSYCRCGEECSWEGEEGKQCWFADYLPTFNFLIAEARDYSVNNAVQWAIQTGIDGFHLETLTHIEESWIYDLRARITSEIEPVTGRRFYLLGDIYTSDRNAIEHYVDPVNTLDGLLDYPLRMSLVDHVLLRNGSMEELESFLASNDMYGDGVMSSFLGQHNLPRVIHFAEDSPVWNNPFAGGEDLAWALPPIDLPTELSAFERVANAYTILFTNPGVPLLFYGDEVGMPGAGIPDNARFMQWSGYTPGQTFLRDYVAALAAIRAEHPALRRGSRSPLAADVDTIAYHMSDGAGDDVIVVINRGDSSTTVSGLPSGEYVDVLDGSSHSGPAVTISGRTARILTLQ